MSEKSCQKEIICLEKALGELQSNIKYLKTRAKEIDIKLENAKNVYLGVGDYSETTVQKNTELAESTIELSGKITAVCLEDTQE